MTTKTDPKLPSLVNSFTPDDPPSAEKILELRDAWLRAMEERALAVEREKRTLNHYHWALIAAYPAQPGTLIKVKAQGVTGRSGVLLGETLLVRRLSTTPVFSKRIQVVHPTVVRRKKDGQWGALLISPWRWLVDDVAWEDLFEIVGTLGEDGQSVK